MRAQVLEQVLQAVNADLVGFADHLGVAVCAGIRSADRDVVRRRAEVFEAFLDRDADGAAAAPQSDEKVRLEPGLVYVGGELKRIPQQIVGLDESFLHGSQALAVR